ncbi:hypothetical protein C2E19_07040 [Pseudomonas sp. DTU12.3]|uniref:hypothetical protein n=1 Tax=Pseudomonas sp. DTU12.3 TaxID=2073078 RepID=UPI0010134258|nr:hypothetical protein [Pseudomonas sp. DTU12.3]QAX83617.1 hypothetical protein C2E19_07040 [Pseudomonas sp. DTU12.3]
MDDIKDCFVKAPKDINASYQAAIEENPANRGASSGRQKRAVIKHRKLWTPGRTLRIRVLAGDAAYKQAVRAAAETWTALINLNFDFVDDGDAEIRISDDGGAYWSLIGTDALTIDDQSEATMNLSPDHNLSLKFFMANAIHEFGHVLGAEHEHLHPHMTIPWDKEAVYEHFGAEDDLARSSIDERYFNLLDASEVDNSAYDPKSIMHYAIRQSWTQGDFQIHLNLQLSDKDKAFMSAAYPHPDA